MNIIYLCPSGNYASLVAANIHLNKLKNNATIKEVEQLPYYLDINSTKGQFYFIGLDNKKRSVYTLAIETHPSIITKTAEDLMKISQKNDKEIKLVDVSPFTPKYIKLRKSPFFKKILTKHISKMLLEIDRLVQNNT
ncbi:DUF3189 family protein [Desulfonispora thiosulfatigenes]|nr:DUF3189 family protein [Desulfonispora thiosulfatigenes]